MNDADRAFLIYRASTLEDGALKGWLIGSALASSPPPPPPPPTGPVVPEPDHVFRARPHNVQQASEDTSESSSSNSAGLLLFTAIIGAAIYAYNHEDTPAPPTTPTTNNSVKTDRSAKKIQLTAKPAKNLTHAKVATPAAVIPAAMFVIESRETKYYAYEGRRLISCTIPADAKLQVIEIDPSDSLERSGYRVDMTEYCPGFKHLNYLYTPEVKLLQPEKPSMAVPSQLSASQPS